MINDENNQTNSVNPVAENNTNANVLDLNNASVVTPVTPVTPVQPVQPVQPTVEATPVAPIAPIAPVQAAPVEAAPATPVAPIAPVTPVTPAAPATPVTPVTPVQAAPVTPVTPVTPVATTPVQPVVEQVPVTPVTPSPMMNNAAPTAPVNNNQEFEVVKTKPIAKSVIILIFLLICLGGAIYSTYYRLKKAEEEENTPVVTSSTTTKIAEVSLSEEITKTFVTNNYNKNFNDEKGAYYCSINYITTTSSNEILKNIVSGLSSEQYCDNKVQSYADITDMIAHTGKDYYDTRTVSYNVYKDYLFIKYADEKVDANEQSTIENTYKMYDLKDGSNYSIDEAKLNSIKEAAADKLIEIINENSIVTNVSDGSTLKDSLIKDIKVVSFDENTVTIDGYGSTVSYESKDLVINVTIPNTYGI